MSYTVRLKDGRRFKVREARSLTDACNAIAHARVSGSIGNKCILNETYIGGGMTVLADVIQINSDNSERVAYTAAY